jgi:hypothetical protein
LWNDRTHPLQEIDELLGGIANAIDHGIAGW